MLVGFTAGILGVSLSDFYPAPAEVIEKDTIELVKAHESQVATYADLAREATKTRSRIEKLEEKVLEFEQVNSESLSLKAKFILSFAKATIAYSKGEYSEAYKLLPDEVIQTAPVDDHTKGHAIGLKGLSYRRQK